MRAFNGQSGQAYDPARPVGSNPTTWCGPCRIIHPVIAELSTEYDGKLKCFKLNTDESPSTTTKYGIRSIPTIMIFKNGEKKDAIIGSVPKTTLISNMKKFL